jgi:hypothetical protein
MFNNSSSYATLGSAQTPFIRPNASAFFSHKTPVAFLSAICDSMSAFLCFEVEVINSYNSLSDL